MGYTTEFEGQFNLNKKLTVEHANYLNAFSETRRMKRDNNIASTLHDHRRVAVSLTLGKEGEYFVGGLGSYGQDHDSSVMEYNSPPSTQPGLWCKWAPTKDCNGIEWSGAEKFYNYVEWLNYIIINFLQPWGYTLNGKVRWRGEDFDDIGVIEVLDNVVIIKVFNK